MMVIHDMRSRRVGEGEKGMVARIATSAWEDGA